MKFRSNILIMMCFLLSFNACKSPKDELLSKIKSNENILFRDTLKTLNETVALETIKLYREFADAYKDDAMASDYLFKAADLALGTNQPVLALESLQSILDDYPMGEKTASSLFMQAFIYETEIGDKDRAELLYLEFIEKYPDHPLHGSAQASYEQLNAGLSDEELIRIFESRQDSLEQSM